MNVFRSCRIKGSPRCDDCTECEIGKNPKYGYSFFTCKMTGKYVGEFYLCENSPRDCPKRENSMWLIAKKEVIDKKEISMEEQKKEQQKTIKVELQIKVADEDIDDIMSTALDSSTLQCWCSEVNVVGRYLGEYASDQISREGELEFYEIEDETYRSLTLENFKDGLRKYLSEEPMSIIRRNDGTLGVDPGMIDEVAADEIIQYALFEEIVYS